MAKKKNQWGSKHVFIKRNALTAAQRQIALSIVDTTLGTPVGIRAIRFGSDENILMELVKNQEPIGYIKIQKDGKPFKCTNLTKRPSPCSYYLEKGKWEAMEVENTRNDY